MIIRPAQMAAFGPSLQEKYLLQVCAHLRTRNLPAVDELAEPELKRRAEIGIARARTHDLDAEWSIAAFVALMFAINPGFDQQPEIAAVLADKSMEPNSRVDALTSKVSRQGWQDATELSSGQIWRGAPQVQVV